MFIYSLKPVINYFIEIRKRKIYSLFFVAVVFALLISNEIYYFVAIWLIACLLDR